MSRKKNGAEPAPQPSCIDRAKAELARIGDDPKALRACALGWAEIAQEWRDNAEVSIQNTTNTIAQTERAVAGWGRLIAFCYEKGLLPTPHWLH